MAKEIAQTPTTVTAAPTATTLGPGQTKVVIDPVTRIEGHLRVTCVVEGGKVTDAWNTATMFRGFEIFMKGRKSTDAWHFAQRICGVCPTPHAHASILATEHAMGLAKVPDNARLFRNMVEAAHVGYDHILWFYILNAFDYVNVPNALNAKPTLPSLKALQGTLKTFVQSGQLGPLANHWWDHPAYKLPAELDLELTSHYLQAIEIQQTANEAQAFIAGKFPMIMNYEPGGMKEVPSIEEIQYYKGQMSIVQDFVDNVMVQDLLTIAPFYISLAGQGQGVGNYLSWGIFDDASQDPYKRLIPRGAIFDRKLVPQKADLDQVRMFTKTSWFGDEVGKGKHPLDAGQEPIQFTKYPEMTGNSLPGGKYDWTQSARYGKEARPMEVGPLADMLVGYVSGQPQIKTLVDTTLKAVGQAGNPAVLMSSLGRVAARVLRAKLNADNAQKWADDLLANMKAGKTQVYEAPPKTDGEGAGGWNAPRGALAHYIRLKGNTIQNYAAVPPTNWNLSPRDDNGVRGPLEQALIGVPVADPKRPLEILRTIHTFDP